VTAEPTPPDPVVGTPRADAARRRVAWALAVAIAVAGVLTALVASGGGAPTALDEALTRVTRDWADALGWPVELTRVIGELTAPRWSLAVAVVAVLALAAARHGAAAGFVALSALAGVAVTEAVKVLVGRTRPPGAGQYEPDLDKSFPSGHASSGIYLYVALGLALVHLGRARGWRWLAAIGWALVVAGPALGLTRLVLGVHWPTDVVAGWAFGSAAALASALLLWDALDRGWRRPDPAVARPTPSGALPPA
jgi:undecaprenyl-diphosphatase